MLRSDEQSHVVVASGGGNILGQGSPNDDRELATGPGYFHAPCGTDGVQEILDGLAEARFTQRRVSPLYKLCEAGSEYAFTRLERNVSSDLLSLLRPRAKHSIKNHFRRSLVQVTRPCLALELHAFRCAYEAIYPQKGSSTPEIERKFLGRGPQERLGSLFKKFPVLGELWFRLIEQWCASLSELLERIAANKQKLSHFFFGGQSLGKILDLRPGLSDSHNKGRTVIRIQFQAGSVIYKPRRGRGEQEWYRFIAYLNAVSFRPKLKAARVLCVADFCWMQEVKFKPCKHQIAVRRFYKRLGGMVTAAYLLQAVDCHRDNIIACGEYPVLVDAETLWHVADEKTDLIDPLYGTGFLPTTFRRRSYQYRSSVLGRTSPGRHTPHVAGTPLYASSYENAFVSGFCQAWQCLLGTRKRRAALVRCLQRLGNQSWRWIYRSTAEYDRIIRASVQPAAMRSETNRNFLLTQLCARKAVDRFVIREEIVALRRLDVPYFSRRATQPLRLPNSHRAPSQIVRVLRHALHL
jgi:lantibiotic modifying enzyme